jgi:hypothetical protein
MHEASHLAIIIGRLRKFAATLAGSPGRAADAAIIEGLLLDLEGRDTPGGEARGRSIELEEVANTLAHVPGSDDVLEAVNSAQADDVN